MASVTPDARLSARMQSATAHWLHLNSKKIGLKKVFLGFCTKADHESTTQKHTKNIPYTVCRILLKTNLQWAKEKTMGNNEDEIDESHKSH